MRRLFKPKVFLASFVVFLGIGLFWSMVGRVREAASLSTCKNNFRQLGTATHNYLSANRGRLPPLTRDDGQVSASVFAILLPFIEADPAYYRTGMTPVQYHANSSIRFPYTGKDGKLGSWNGGVVNLVRRTFVDPADTSATLHIDVPVSFRDGSTGYYATGSYVANGLIPWGSEVVPDSFPDGAANGILFAERPQVCKPTDGNPVQNLYGLGIYSPHMPTFGTLSPSEPLGLPSTNQAAPVAPLPDEASPERASRIMMRVGRQDTPPEASDFPSPIQFFGKGRACDPRIPGTPHRAGLQVGLADGSTRVFGMGTDPWVFWEACLRGEAMRRKADRN